MVSMVTSFLSMSLVSAFAFANAEIEGKYKLIRRECSSGTVAVDKPIIEKGMSTSSSVDLIITSTQIQTKFDYLVKLDHKVGSYYVNLIEDSIARISGNQQTPNQVEKLMLLKESLETTKHVMSGAACSVSTVQNYIVADSKFYLTPVSQVSSCKDTVMQSRDEEYVIDASGDLLKVTTSDFDHDILCPVGDSKNIVYVFKRLN